MLPMAIFYKMHPPQLLLEKRVALRAKKKPLRGKGGLSGAYPPWEKPRKKIHLKLFGRFGTLFPEKGFQKQKHKL